MTIIGMDGRELVKSSGIVAKGRKWRFEDVRGKGFDLPLKAGADPESMCCVMVERTGVPMRCFPVLEVAR